MSKYFLLFLVLLPLTSTMGQKLGLQVGIDAFSYFNSEKYRVNGLGVHGGVHFGQGLELNLNIRHGSGGLSAENILTDQEMEAFRLQGNEFINFQNFNAASLTIKKNLQISTKGIVFIAIGGDYTKIYQSVFGEVTVLPNGQIDDDESYSVFSGRCILGASVQVGYNHTIGENVIVFGSVKYHTNPSFYGPNVGILHYFKTNKK